MYGGEARLSTLQALFPLMEDKRSLMSKVELASVDGKASLLAAVDYYVCSQSDIFVSASPGNMHNALVGLLLSLPFSFFSQLLTFNSKSLILFIFLHDRMNIVVTNEKRLVIAHMRI